MKYHTVLARLTGALANAAAVEWTNLPAPVESGQGWEPCLRLGGGLWRFESHDPAGPQTHRRAHGPFRDLAIRYRLSAAGPWSPAAASRQEVMIVEEGFVPPVAPFAIAAPAIAGAAVIGTELAVDPGLWGGEPAPELLFQWRRGGADIPGAAASAYTPQPEDDLAEIGCAVTARNLAGEAVAIAAAGPAVHPAPRLVATLPAMAFDEGDGPQLVPTAAAFAGAALRFSALGAAIDAATGVVTVATDAPVAGATVVVTAANSGGQASASFVYAVAAAPAPRTPMQIAMTFAPDEIADAMNQELLVYNDAADANERGEGQGLNFGFTHHAPALVALEAWAAPLTGTTAIRAVSGSRALATAPAETGQAALYRHLRSMIGDQLGANADRAPAGRGGFQAQLEANFVAMVAVARIVPEVWSRFSAAEKTRMKVCTKGIAVGVCFGISVAHPFDDLGRTIRGYTCNAWTAPNFSTPHHLLPFVIDQFLRQDGETLQAFLSGYDRDGFAAEVQAAGKLGAMLRTFKPSVLVAGATHWNAAVQTAAHGGPSALGDGATQAQLEATIKQGGALSFEFRGWEIGSRNVRLNDPVNTVFGMELARCFSGEILPGLKNKAGAAGANGANCAFTGRSGPVGTPWAADKYGLNCLNSRATAGYTKACLGRPPAAGQADIDIACWSKIPYAPGTLGMPVELNTTDGGSPTAEFDRGPTFRSSMTYAWHATSLCPALVAVMVAYGLITKENFDQVDALPRFDRGMFMTALIFQEGWLSYAKGGLPSNSNTLVDQAWADQSKVYNKSLCGTYVDTNTRFGLHRALWSALKV